MNAGKLALIVVLAVAAVVAWGAMFTVDERERAIKFQFGQIVKSDFEPGLHFKWPFVNNVRKYDARVLTLDARPSRYLTQEKKNVIVDFFAKWRINDVATFYRTMGDEVRALERIYAIVNDGLRSEFSNRTIQEVVSGQRSQIMESINARASQQVAPFGIEVVDVRIKRIDLPREVSSYVYKRMEAERARVAKELRASGAEQAEKIKADADRQARVLRAEAYKQAEQVRGDGDARATEVYAAAFQRDPEFYAFYRSLDAYRSTFNKQGDILVLEPDSEFFRYFTGTEPGRALREAAR